MKPVTLSIALAFCCGIMHSCKQPDYNPLRPHEETMVELQKNMQPFREAMKIAPQKFTINAGTPQTVKCNNGTTLDIAANSFRDKDGNVISKGSVNLEITEMYKPADMVSNIASTVTGDGYFLQSGGQVNISASSNGKPVYANKYSISFKMKDSTKYPMSLYYGSKNEDSVLSWKDADRSNIGTTARYDNFQYIFDTCTSFGYINCDRLPKDSGTTHIFLKAPDPSFKVINTQIYLVLPAINSFVQNRIRSFDEATNTFKFGDDGSNVPVGMDFKIVMIANVNDKYYYFDTTGKTTKEDVYLNAHPTLQDMPYIISKIKSL
ncbi:MAG: hypothetical protein JWQ38_1686 [Flavipsychrobacter sp.]|nr:hypothetical protein [Flavipsychrobacter sp.]